MKFEQKHPEAKTDDQFEFEYLHVVKGKLGECSICGSYTRWIDGSLQQNVCSEECCSKLWIQDKPTKQLSKLAETELAIASVAEPAWKDIIIVVRDQLSYLKTCIESVRQHTKDYTLYIWDNGSNAETQEYLTQLQMEHVANNFLDWDIEVWRSEVNEGFIKPNNKLAELGDGKYIILLNSDTKVFEHWDTAMIGWLQQNSEVAQIGYWGGHLGPDGRGFGGESGYDIDYVPGWCFCITRETYNQHGLFNETDLQFAYCEDSDFSLRLLESGKRIYALHIPLVHHYQNKTIQAVKQEGVIDVRSSFDHNHEYIRLRWQQYLDTKRVLLKRISDEVRRDFSR